MDCNVCGDTKRVNVLGPEGSFVMGMTDCPTCGNLHRYSDGTDHHFIYRGPLGGPGEYLAACTSKEAADAAYRLLTS
jgi:hypothetical protein